VAYYIIVATWDLPVAHRRARDVRLDLAHHATARSGAGACGGVRAHACAHAGARASAHAGAHAGARAGVVVAVVVVAVVASRRRLRAAPYTVRTCVHTGDYSALCRDVALQA